MENRDRDKMSRNTTSTEAGDINRATSSQRANEQDDSTAEFGQNIGRSESLNEPNRRGAGGSGMLGSSGTSESMKNRDENMNREHTGSSKGRH